MAGSLVLNALCPFVAFKVLEGQGVDTVPALAATAVFPVAGILVGFARTRRVDGLGVLVLGFIVLGGRRRSSPAARGSRS